jgi:c-di-GMP-binding flagellar brake protein YcgR
MDERREEKRIDCYFPLEFVTQNKTIKVTAINISNSGICFKSQEPIPLFRELKIKLLLPKKDKDEKVSGIPIECTGIVVRCDKEGDAYETALFFMDISLAEQNWLNIYIETNSPK